MSKQSGQQLFQQGQTQYFLAHYAQALQFFQKSAQQEYPPAYVRLARMYAKGSGVTESKAQSSEWEAKIKQNIPWFQTQANSGNVEAQFCFGICYETGAGVEKDEKQAATWYKRAAEQKHAGAQLYLGALYVDGSGVVKDEKQAVTWYQKAADQNNPEAQFVLGACYEQGSGFVKDEKQTVTWCRRAADQGHTDAQFSLGVYYSNGFGVTKNEKQGAAWYRKAADQGHPQAQFYLARRYAQGSGVSKSEKEALALVRKAAEQGVAEAQYYLGCCHSAPYLVPSGISSRKHFDRHKASIWFLQAAEKGHARAQFELLARPDLFPDANFGGKLGIPKNSGEAFLWYQKAAAGESKLDIGVAQYHLAASYEFGRGVETDRQQAMFWFKKALENGVSEANDSIKSLSSSVVCQSREEADALVQEWLKPKPSSLAPTDAKSSGSAPSAQDPLLKNQAGTSYSVSMFSIPAPKPKEKEDSLCSSCNIL